MAIVDQASPRATSSKSRSDNETAPFSIFESKRAIARRSPSMACRSSSVIVVAPFMRRIPNAIHCLGPHPHRPWRLPVE